MAFRLPPILLVCMMFALGTAQAEDLGREWRALGAGETKLLFLAPELQDQRVRYLRSESEKMSYVVENGIWTGPEAHHPKAMIQYLKLSPGYHFRVKPQPSELIERFKAFEDQDIELDDDGTHINKLGRMDYQLFRFSDVVCMVFLQQWGVSSEGMGNEQLGGYYCANPGETLPGKTATAILQTVGIRGSLLPPLPEASASAQIPPKAKVPLKAWFDGGDEALQGEFSAEKGIRRGSLQVQLPEPYGLCKGSWNISGSSGEGRDLKLGSERATGTWLLRCANGKGIKGAYRSSGTMSGRGDGEDSRGRKLTFTYGRGPGE